MKNLRKLLLAAIILLAGIFLVACNDDDDAKDKEEIQSAVELLAVRFKTEGDTLRNVTGDLLLDATFGKATITWSSDKESVIDNDGKVTRGDDDVVVTLTATIKVNKLSENKNFEVTVKALVYTTYVVSFSPSGGSPSPEAQTVREGQLAVKPLDPTRDRYALEGWYLEEELYDFSTPITKAISLTAKWTIVEPLVSFNLGYAGGVQIDPQRLDLNDKATKPADPTREGYKFEGWTLNDNDFDFETPITDDTVLTAKWEQEEVVISFDLGYGVNPENQTIGVGGLIVEPVVEARDRFEFLGWYLEDAIFNFTTPVTVDTHLVARWEQLTAIVTFDANGGSPTPATETLEIGKTLAEPAEPTRDGYDFLGWLDGASVYVFGEPVEKDLNLIASWVESNIVISATILGPDAITHYIGTRTFDPLSEYTAIDNDSGEEYELVASGVYNPNFPYTYNYTVSLKLDPSITKQVKLTVIRSTNIIPNGFSGQQVNITFWHSNGSTIENKLLQYGTDFEAYMLTQGVNIKVNIVKNGSNYDELRTNVVNAIKGAELPNLVQNYPDHVVEYQANGVIESLTPYIYHPVHGLDPENPNENLEDIVMAYREENRSNNLIGDYLSMPFNKSTEVVAYNKTFFDEVLGGRAMPETWQGLFGLVDDIYEIKDEQIDKIAANWAAGGAPLKAEEIAKAKNEFVPFTYDSVGNAFITLTRQFGGQYTSRDPVTGKGQVDFINANTIRMLKFFAEDRGRTFTVPQNWGVDYGNAVSFQGTTLFSAGSTGGLRYNNAVKNGYKLYDVGVMTVPYDQQNPSSRTVIQQGTNISLTTAGSAEQKLASWLFLKYLTSTDIQADFGIATGYTPVRLSSIQTAAYQEFLEAADIELADSASAMGLSNSAYEKLAEQKLVAMGARVAAEQTQYMFYDNAFIGSSKAREEVGSAFERVMLAPKNQDIDTVINNALQAAKEETERVIP